MLTSRMEVILSQKFSTKGWKGKKRNDIPLRAVMLKAITGNE
jgi:hypothetical protein